MTNQRYQRIVVWLAVLYLYSVMLIVAVVFSTTNTRSIEIVLTSHASIFLTPITFAAMSFAATLSACLQLLPFTRRIKPIRRQVWYALSAFPLVLYTVPVAQTAINNHTTGIGVVVYLVVYVSFLVIAAATFRPKLGS